MSAAKQRQKVLSKISGDIDDAFSLGHLNVTDLHDRNGLLACVVLVLPARLGRRLADIIQDEWRRRGGEVEDTRTMEGN